MSFLLELQSYCDKEAEVKKRFRESAASLADQEKTFHAIDKQYEDLKKKVAENKSQLLDLNLQLASVEGNVKKWNTELFTTHNANPKYLREIEVKIKENENSKSKLEDSVLELMDQLETDEKKAASVEKEYQEIKGLLDMKRQAHLSLETETKEELKDLERKKEEIRLQIDMEWLQIFDKTFLQCQGKAVSVIHKGACQICKFMVPTSKLDQLYHHQEELHFCDNCKRIIMVG